MIEIAWDEGTWTHPPVDTALTPEGHLLVTAADQSDAWRHTSYGFVHESEHALLRPLEIGRAVEVSFRCEFSEAFDQAGVFVSFDPEHWIKAGVERSDGADQVGAVVTNVRSDWSVAPVPEWSGRVVTVRVSRARESVTIRARVDSEPMHLVRVAPTPPDAAAGAGPMVCAPSRPGLVVEFLAWREGPADDTLHEADPA